MRKDHPTGPPLLALALFTSAMLALDACGTFEPSPLDTASLRAPTIGFWQEECPAQVDARTPTLEFHVGPPPSLFLVETCSEDWTFCSPSTENGYGKADRDGEMLEVSCLEGTNVRLTLVR